MSPRMRPTTMTHRSATSSTLASGAWGGPPPRVTELSCDRYVAPNAPALLAGAGLNPLTAPPPSQTNSASTRPFERAEGGSDWVGVATNYIGILLNCVATR